MPWKWRIRRQTPLKGRLSWVPANGEWRIFLYAQDDNTQEAKRYPIHELFERYFLIRHLRGAGLEVAEIGIWSYSCSVYPLRSGRGQDKQAQCLLMALREHYATFGRRSIEWSRAADTLDS